MASRDDRVSSFAKLLIVILVAYALSPVDLIPDFIPVLGYLDDLVIIPLGIALVVKLVPADVWRECEEKAVQQLDASVTAKGVVTLVIVLIWVSILLLLGTYLWRVVD